MKTWTETEETTTQLFEEFEGVIYHVMKKLNIQKNNSEYDDFLQEGRLLLGDYYYWNPIRKANRIHLSLRMRPSNLTPIYNGSYIGSFSIVLLRKISKP